MKNGNLDKLASSDAIVIRPNSDEFRGLTLLTASTDQFVAEKAQSMKEGSKMPRGLGANAGHPVNFPPSNVLR